MGRYFKNILDGVKTVLIGMKVTWRHLFTPAVTIQYPDVKLKLPDRARNRLYVPRFEIDIAKCCYCGLCVYPCPTECIKMTDVYEFSEYERKNLIYNYVTVTPSEVIDIKARA